MEEDVGKLKFERTKGLKVEAWLEEEMGRNRKERENGTLGKG